MIEKGFLIMSRCMVTNFKFLNFLLISLCIIIIIIIIIMDFHDI